MAYAYKNIPVDKETAQWLAELCEAYEMGERSKGAMVRKLVKAEREKLVQAKLLNTKVEAKPEKPTNKKS